jgi:hypothetical protein
MTSKMQIGKLKRSIGWHNQATWQFGLGWKMSYRQMEISMLLWMRDFGIERE